MNKKNNNTLKTGIEVINTFFEKLNIDKNKYSNQQVVNIILKLYSSGKLSQTNISNALNEIREENATK